MIECDYDGKYLGNIVPLSIWISIWVISTDSTSIIMQKFVYGYFAKLFCKIPINMVLHTLNEWGTKGMHTQVGHKNIKIWLNMTMMVNIWGILFPWQSGSVFE